MKKKLKIIFKPFFVYFHSYMIYHISILVFSFVTFKIYTKLTLNSEPYFFTEILNGFGLLTAFYILALDKLDFDQFKHKYKSLRTLPLIRAQIPFGKKIINTVFTATISMFLLLGFNYLSLLLGKQSYFLLFYLGWYLFSGFFIVLILWHSQQI